MRKYANIRICGIISAYAMSKTQLYGEKYAICGFLQKNAIVYAIACSHITGFTSLYTCSIGYQGECHQIGR